MTESEWLVSAKSQTMLAEVSDKGSERLWRLFAVACVRTLADRMRDVRSVQALEVAERFADGTATLRELRAARARAEAAAVQAHRDEWEDEVRANFHIDAHYRAVCEAMRAADSVLPCLAEEVGGESVRQSLCLPDLLREVFGNPFCWKLVDPAWLEANDGAARRLAETIYEARSFELLPILGDALEDAGCNDDALLGHLRGPGPHVRGCWALDLVLGKE